MKVSSGWLLFFVMAIMTTAPQTSEDFHSRYGQPDLERFTVRPEVSLLVEYGHDALPCQMQIEPRHALVHDENSEASMAMGTVAEVLSEVVPVSTRGILLLRSNSQMSRLGSELTQYQNVSVTTQTLTDGVQTPRALSVFITFRREACKNLPN